MTIASTCTDPELIRLAEIYEMNLRAYTVAMAEEGDGYVQRDNDATMTAFPYTYWINGVVSPLLPVEGTRARLDEILGVFRRLGREVWFTVGPSSEPTDIARILKARGLRNYHNRPFMACRLADHPTEYPIPAEITVHTVDDYGLFSLRPHPILKRIATARKRHIISTFSRLMQKRPRKHWMFIADWAGTPVGTAIVYLHRGSAGIYDVEVLEECRGQGIGTALLQSVCAFSRDQGAETAVLAASEQGTRFYPRFGFQLVGRYPTYYYSIAKQKADAARESAEIGRE